jgi:hypothetical protein
MSYAAKFLGRFWSKVIRTQSCWVWAGCRTAFGHGQLTALNQTLYAHRTAWELHHGVPVPAGMVVMHVCDNPACVRPDHLRVGTQQDNQADCDAKGRRARGKHSGTYKHGRYSKYTEAA